MVCCEYKLGETVMRKFKLNKLWELRAELDNAIIDKNYDVMQGIGQKYQSLVNEEKWFNRAFICYNHAFWNDGEKSSHIFSNINSIARNIEDYERKYFDGEDVSIKLKSQSVMPFLAGEIWVLRAMYDKFLLESKNQENELAEQQNMILGKATIDRLKTLLSMEQTEDYYDEIRPILVEVREGYEKIYGKRQPRISYGQLAEEFMGK